MALSIFSFVVAAVFICLFILAIIRFGSDYGHSCESQSLKNFEENLSSLAHNENIKIFTNEHPYVWVENTANEARQKIKDSCPRGKFGLAAGLAKYQIKVDRENSHIFVALNTSPKQQWPALKLYEEWLESNKQVAENIAKHTANGGKNA
jgi:hypothetical protein